MCVHRGTYTPFTTNLLQSRQLGKGIGDAAIKRVRADIVGGNLETIQKVLDNVLFRFKVCALSIVPDDRYEIGERPPGEVVVRVCDQIAFVSSVAMLMDVYTYHQRLNVGEEVKITTEEIDRKALKYPILCGRQDPICVQLLHTDSKHTLLVRMRSLRDVR